MDDVGSPVCEDDHNLGKWPAAVVAGVFSSLIDQLALPVWIFDAALQVAYDNKTSWGVGAGQSVVGAGVDDFSIDVSRMLRQGITACLSHQKNCLLEGWVESDVLGRCYMQFNFQRLPSNLVACVLIDQTSSKQVEKLLLSSETKYRSLVETMRDGVWVHRRDFTISFVNESICHMLDYPRTELIGRSLLDLVAPESRDLLIAQAELGTESEFEPYEVQLVARSGSRLVVSVSPAPNYDATSNSINYFAVITDVTERRIAEDALRESEQRYRAVIEDQTELICRADLEGRLTFANKAYCRFFNCAVDQVKGRYFIQLVPEEELVLIRQALARITREQPTGTVEHRAILENGSVRWLKWQVRGIRSESGRITEFQAIGHDITERKVYYQELVRYQNQLRKLTAQLSLTEDRERRRIATGLHDEIGHSLSLARQRISEMLKQETAADKIALLNEGLELIQQVIDTSRSLTFELSPPVHHEGGFITSLEWLVEDIAGKSDLRVDFFDDRRPKPLSADLRVLLFQASRELLVNAVKHARADRLELSVTRVGNEVLISVTDNGIGMSTPATQPPNKTGGFGLFAIRERLGQSGGRMEFLVPVDAGTCVTLYVPVAVGADSHLDSRAEAAAGPAVVDTGTRDKPRLMLVDDHLMVREGLRALLQREGGLVIVGEAGDGRTAVELAQKLEPDIVIMDVDLPALTGIEATRRITAAFPDIKVIALTMHRDKRYVSEMLNAGASGYLLKDNAHEHLMDAIARVSAGDVYLCQPVLESMIADYLAYCKSSQPAKPSELTVRERDILRLLADGRSTKEIARQFGLSAKTVETHRRRITDKLDIRSVAELTKYAIREGISALED